MFYMNDVFLNCSHWLFEKIQMDLNVRFMDQHYAFWVGKLVPKYREESAQDKGCVATLNSAKWLWFTRTPGLRSRLLQLDVHALVITHSLDAISPLRHTGAEANVAKKARVVTGHFCEGQTLMIVLRIQILIPYLYRARTLYDH